MRHVPVLLEETLDLFELQHVSGLPVVDGQQRLLGVITEYDLLQSIGTLQLNGKVADFMTSDVTTVGEDVPLVELRFRLDADGGSFAETATGDV